MYDLAFANVDGRLTLWVDGDLPFGAGETTSRAASRPARPPPTSSRCGSPANTPRSRSTAWS